MNQYLHIPVMLSEALFYLQPKPTDVVVDATFGMGGYARAILAKGVACLIGIDRDPDAVVLGQNLMQSNSNFQMSHGRFSDLANILSDCQKSTINAIVFDVGVSSLQLDCPSRGFSFSHDGPLDMRMGQDGISALEIINSASVENLADIFFHFGEERHARAVARAIVNRRRDIGPITRTKELAKLVEQVVGRPRAWRHNTTHPATRVFQAIRIAVNEELSDLQRALYASLDALDTGGRLVVVTFHALEDRIVKNFFKAHSEPPKTSRHEPPVIKKMTPNLQIITKKAVSPSDHEINANNRARSAKLRAAIKI